MSVFSSNGSEALVHASSCTSGKTGMTPSYGRIETTRCGNGFLLPDITEGFVNTGMADVYMVDERLTKEDVVIQETVRGFSTKEILVPLSLAARKSLARADSMEGVER